MGEIIVFDINRKKKKSSNSFSVADKRFKETSEQFKHSYGEEELADFLESMRTLAKEALKNPHLKEVMNESNRLYEDFKRRYKEIINNAPKCNSGIQMQYYAKVMFNLIPFIFHAEVNNYHYFSDFADFYSFFDDAYSDFLEQYRRLDTEPYHFTDELIYNIDKLEETLTNCLQEIIKLKPDENDKQKTKLIHKSNELFEIYRSMLYFFDNT